MNRTLAVLAGLALAGCAGEAVEPEADGLSQEPVSTVAQGLVAVDRMGINPGDLTDLGRVDAVVNQFKLLGAKWARVEIHNTRTPDHWSAVVDKFNAAGINVLGVLSNQTWSGGAQDPDACGYYPGNFGWRLVNEFIPSADPYVQRLKNRVRAWELWNEANAGNTWLCPGNYAFLLVEARLRWPDIGDIGTSTLTLGSNTDARDYLSTLYTNTDKVLWYRNTYGSAPWTKAMHHPYPGGQTPETFIPNQASMLRAVQPRPLWFTEIGWFGGGADEAGQADMLRRAFEKALNGNYAEKMFWFSLYDCTAPETYGLIEGCFDSYGQPRRSWWAFREVRGCGKSALQASTGHWVVAEGGGGAQVLANRTSIGPWESFRVVPRGGGKIALQASSGHYVVAESGGGRELLANRTGIGAWESFYVDLVGGTKVALRADNGQWWRAEGGGGGWLYANSGGVGSWETFNLACGQ